MLVTDQASCWDLPLPFSWLILLESRYILDFELNNGERIDPFLCSYLIFPSLHFVTIKIVPYRVDKTALYSGYNKREMAVFSLYIYVCIYTHTYIYVYIWTYVWSEVAQSCPTLCDPMDGSLPGSSLHGILQARVLEWVAISFSRGSSRPRDRAQVSLIPGRRFNLWATREPMHMCVLSRMVLATENKQ